MFQNIRLNPGPSCIVKTDDSFLFDNWSTFFPLCFGSSPTVWHCLPIFHANCVNPFRKIHKHPPRLLVWRFAFFLSRVFAKGFIQGGSRDDILIVFDGKHLSMTRLRVKCKLESAVFASSLLYTSSQSNSYSFEWKSMTMTTSNHVLPFIWHQNSFCSQIMT